MHFWKARAPGVWPHTQVIKTAGEDDRWKSSIRHGTQLHKIGVVPHAKNHQITNHDQKWIIIYSPKNGGRPRLPFPFNGHFSWVSPFSDSPIGCIPWPLSTLRWSWGWTDTQCAGDNAWGFRRPGTTGIPMGCQICGSLFWVSRCPSLAMAIWDGITGHQGWDVEIWSQDVGYQSLPRWANMMWCQVMRQEVRVSRLSISSRKNQGDIPDSQLSAAPDWCKQNWLAGWPACFEHVLLWWSQLAELFQGSTMHQVSDIRLTSLGRNGTWYDVSLITWCH